MHIKVLNGSPKGNNSVTLFTAKFIAKNFPQHTFEMINVAQKVRSYEKNPSQLQSLKEADIIVFAYPVYTFIAPAQLHRIIELIKEENIDLSGKWVTQISTSKHVYDFTAHRYIEDNAADLNMRIIPGLSADMDDILTPKGQETALAFWRSVEFAYNNTIEQSTIMRAIQPSAASPKISLPAPAAQTTEKSDKFDTVLVTYLTKKEGNLYEMIEYFKAIYPNKLRIVNIAEFKFTGGCFGCLKCADTAKCIQKDRFDDFLRTEIQSSNATIYAFDIKDHSMGSVFKTYDDRNFCNGHRTTTMGTPVGYIVAGKLSQEDNLRTLINARANVGHNYLAYVASDEFDAAKDLQSLASQLDYALQNKLILPQNFLGVGGHKIFRDLIYEMRGIMSADHKFYKEKGFYDDFPQRKWKRSLLMKLVGWMMKNPKFSSKMQAGMTAPYKKMLGEE